MSKMKMLKEAICESGIYSPNQCKVISTLLDITTNNVAQATVKFLVKKTGVKSPTIYFALKTFQKDGLIIKNEQQGGFEFQQDKIDFYLESQSKKNAL